MAAPTLQGNAYIYEPLIHIIKAHTILMITISNPHCYLDNLIRTGNDFIAIQV